MHSGGCPRAHGLLWTLQAACLPYTPHTSPAPGPVGSRGFSSAACSLWAAGWSLWVSLSVSERGGSSGGRAAVCWCWPCGHRHHGLGQPASLPLAEDEPCTRLRSVGLARASLSEEFELRSQTEMRRHSDEGVEPAEPRAGPTSCSGLCQNLPSPAAGPALSRRISADTPADSTLCALCRALVKAGSI